MTIEQAKNILATYTLPMTAEQKRLYMMALTMCSNYPLRKL